MNEQELIDIEEELRECARCVLYLFRHDIISTQTKNIIEEKILRMAKKNDILLILPFQKRLSKKEEQRKIRLMQRVYLKNEIE